jgi:hypothetical protein
VLWAADQADELLGVAEIQVAAVMAVHGAAVPWGRVDTDGVTVVPARRLPDLLLALPPVLGPERVAWPADRAGSGSAPPPSSLFGPGWLQQPLPRPARGSEAQG